MNTPPEVHQLSMTMAVESIAILRTYAPELVAEFKKFSPKKVAALPESFKLAMSRLDAALGRIAEGMKASEALMLQANRGVNLEDDSEPVSESDYLASVIARTLGVAPDDDRILDDLSDDFADHLVAVGYKNTPPVSKIVLPFPAGSLAVIHAFDENENLIAKVKISVLAHVLEQVPPGEKRTTDLFWCAMLRSNEDSVTEYPALLDLSNVDIVAELLQLQQGEFCTWTISFSLPGGTAVFERTQF